MQIGKEKIFLILIVDDSIDVRKLTMSLLKSRLSGRVEFIEAESVDGGVAVLKKNKVAAVICDYQMPGKNGLALLDYIRCRRPELPFILYTGSDEFDEPMEQMLRPGIDTMVKKPFCCEIAAILKKEVLEGAGSKSFELKERGVK